MRRFSYERSFGGLVFAAPNGESFPVSVKATENIELNDTDNDMLDGVMFTMRSEPTVHDCGAGGDNLETVMFTMRSEPTEFERLSESRVS